MQPIQCIVAGYLGMASTTQANVVSFCVHSIVKQVPEPVLCLLGAVSEISHLIASSYFLTIVGILFMLRPPDPKRLGQGSRYSCHIR